jgi:hypothetical protein
MTLLTAGLTQKNKITVYIVPELSMLDSQNAKCDKISACKKSVFNIYSVPNNARVKAEILPGA